MPARQLSDTQFVCRSNRLTASEDQSKYQSEEKEWANTVPAVLVKTIKIIYNALCREWKSNSSEKQLLEEWIFQFPPF